RNPPVVARRHCPRRELTEISLDGNGASPRSAEPPPSLETAASLRPSPSATRTTRSAGSRGAIGWPGRTRRRVTPSGSVRWLSPAWPVPPAWSWRQSSEPRWMLPEATGSRETGSISWEKPASWRVWKQDDDLRTPDWLKRPTWRFALPTPLAILSRDTPAETL